MLSKDLLRRAVDNHITLIENTGDPTEADVLGRAGYPKLIQRLRNGSIFSSFNSPASEHILTSDRLLVQAEFRRPGAFPLLHAEDVLPGPQTLSCTDLLGLLHPRQAVSMTVISRFFYFILPY
jgi:hypothetical protein